MMIVWCVFFWYALWLLIYTTTFQWRSVLSQFHFHYLLTCFTVVRLSILLPSRKSYHFAFVFFSFCFSGFIFYNKEWLVCVCHGNKLMKLKWWHLYSTSNTQYNAYSLLLWLWIHSFCPICAIFVLFNFPFRIKYGMGPDKPRLKKSIWRIAHREKQFILNCGPRHNDRIGGRNVKFFFSSLFSFKL